MKNLIIFITVALAAAASGFAHCGACSVGEKAHAAHGEHGGHGAAGCADHALLKYLKIQDSLASDNLGGAQAAAKELQLTGKACSIEGKECCTAMKHAADGIASAADIGAARLSFQTLSNNLIARIEEKGLSHGSVVKMHCPMAMEGKGASWIQDTMAVRNPYYGASMLTCGMPQAKIGEVAAKAAGEDGHGCEDKACCAVDKKDS